MKLSFLIALTILSSAAFAQSGNVGIGTSTPSTPLHVVGTVSSTSATSAASSTESTQLPPGAVELFRSTSSTAGSVNGYIDFKDNSTKDFDLRLLYDHTLGTNGGFSIVTSTNGGATNAGRFTLLNSDGRIGIGTSAPDASARLDISSTSQGVLVPRITTAQRIAISAPATGLLVYQTDSNAGFWHYDGSRWTSLNTTGIVRTVSASTTLLPTDNLVAVSTPSYTTTLVTLTLPLASSVSAGYQLRIISTDPTDQTYYDIKIQRQSSNNLIWPGQGNFAFGAISAWATLVSDGNNTWYITSWQ